VKHIILSFLFITVIGFSAAHGFDKPLLDVSASVKTQNACLDENGFAFKNDVFTSIKSVRIDLDLNVVYENKGTLPIILDTGTGAVWGYRIYDKNADSTPGYVKRGADFELMFSGDEPSAEGNEPSKRFTILRKGDFFSSQSETRLLFDYQADYPNYDGKEYFVSLELYSVGGELEQKNNLNDLRQRWLNIGYFWFENLETKPILIKFPNVKNLMTCK
jgi:hypothetical protein